MPCAPGFYPSLRHTVAIRQIVKILKNIFYLHFFFYPVSNALLKIGLLFFFYNCSGIFQQLRRGFLHGDGKAGQLLQALGEVRGLFSRARHHRQREKGL